MRLNALASLSRLSRRSLLGLAAALTLPVLAQAQTTPIKFQLDWRFEGPSAFFLVPAAKGYFKAEKLDVTIDAGTGLLHGPACPNEDAYTDYFIAGTEPTRSCPPRTAVVSKKNP